MSHSLRFLGVAVATWVGVRAVSLGMVPGLDSIAFDKAEAATAAPTPALALPPVEPSDLPPPPPMQAAAYPAYAPNPAYAGSAPYPYAYPYPPYYPAAYGPPPRTIVHTYIPRDAVSRRRSPAPAYVEMASLPPDFGGAMARGGASPPRRSVPVAPSDPTFAAPARFDRWQMTTWAMLRSRPGPSSLAANGTLGGSQGGTRVLYRFDRRLAASLRVSAPINAASRGGEAALGVRYQPLASIPVAFTAERRQAFGHGAGHSAFALFAEGGVYQRPITAGFALDAYLQAGVVGPRHRAAFVDGSATLTRPLFRNVSGGLGAWGGVQPGLTRLDVGPRVSMKVGRTMRAHLDYRYRALGNAEPGSGAVVTLAGDF